ncbi:MAG: 30S ribosomal protein S3 [Candidatus Heimdallarchaeota archaeon]|nr:30S ribosomal protein S3 [Candidatus Heimdallarchaeota archaeon]MBY8995967.1 30S ribosomal protein S3 [Candidatus Heimdallarchaeota archaeon]
MSAVNHFIKKGVRQARIDEFLARELARAGYGGVDIAKTPLGERVTIYASRPGIVIGRRGKNIRSITDELVSSYGFENPQIEVKEVVNPDTNPRVMAFSLVSAIERGVHRRRAAYSCLRRVVNAGAKGCEIIIAGKLTSKRSRHEAYRMGLLAKSGEIGAEVVKTAHATAVMKLGTIGVTVSIMRGDIVLPDEISIHSVRLDEETDEFVPDVEEIKPEKPVPSKEEAPKKEEKPAKKEEKPKAKEETSVTKKKTDLDIKVEELSDLIEKTPGEEKKPKKPVAKKTTPAKTEPKAKPKTTKPTATKTAEKPKAAAKKPVKKETPTKKTTAAKKPETTPKKTTTKKDEAKQKDTKKTDSTKATKSSKSDKEDKKKKKK